MPGDLWAGVDEIVSAGIAVRTGSHVRIQNQMLRAHIFLGHAAGGKNRTSPPIGWGRRNRGSPGVAVASEPHPGHAPDTSFSLLRLAVELVRADETQCAVEYIERALAINPREAETAARLVTVAEVLFSRGEFVHAKRYLDWAQRVTKDRALTLRLTGLDFQIELMKGNSMRPSMMIRLIRSGITIRDSLLASCPSAPCTWQNAGKSRTPGNCWSMRSNSLVKRPANPWP